LIFVPIFAGVFTRLLSTGPMFHAIFTWRYANFNNKFYNWTNIDAYASSKCHAANKQNEKCRNFHINFL